MPLTATQKTKIIQLLGYPGKSLIPGSILYDKILADRLDNLNAEIENLVSSMLGKITVIETQMGEAPARNIVKKVGDIELNTGEMTDLRSERKRYLKELGLLLDIPYIGGGGVNVSICN